MMHCDGCGELRKVHRVETVIIFGDVDDKLHFCFLCVKEAERMEKKELRKAAREFLRPPLDTSHIWLERMLT